MFAQTWRKHWGLAEDPFAFEDADKDPILARIDPEAVHSSFDRVYGSTSTPGPGIVFGEKGSGKSSLRRAVRSRIEEHNERQAAAGDGAARRAFAVEYTDFDLFLESFRQASRLSLGKEKTAGEVARRFGLADHLDAVLSLATTGLVDRLTSSRESAAGLTEKQKLNLLTLTALYYHSKKRTTAEAVADLRASLRYHSSRESMVLVGRALLTLLGVAVAVVPFLGFVPFIENLLVQIPPRVWFWTGAAIVALTWTWALLHSQRLRSTVSRAVRSVRVLPRDAMPLRTVLAGLRPQARKEVTLPVEQDEATRYDLLQSLLDCLEVAGYDSLYVLVDRVDESTLLEGREEHVRRFVEKLLDHRLLQFPGLAVKLFLPVELGQMYLGATPDELKRMRLDKSNTVQELRWTGQELLEVANQRLRAAAQAGEGAPHELIDFFRGDMDAHVLRETFHELGTPRYAFGFLSALFADYLRNLPNELDPQAEEWRVPRQHFEFVRASWTNRSRALRQVLN